MVERLALIALGRAAGFSLDEIARMFASEGQPRIDRQLLATKADELDRTILKLSAMRDGLRHAAACPAPSHMECPTFSAHRAGCGGCGGCGGWGCGEEEGCEGAEGLVRVCVAPVL